jgi:hypothetical protein
VRHPELVIVGIPAVAKVNSIYQRAVTISMGNIVNRLPLKSKPAKS